MRGGALTLPRPSPNANKNNRGLGRKYQVAGANRRWRWQFRYRGSRRESAVAQLSTLGIIDVCDMRPVKKIAIRVFLGLVIVYLVLLLLAHSVFMVKRMKTG